MWFTQLPADADAPEINFDQGILTLSGICMPDDCDYTLGSIFSEIYEYIRFNDSFTLVLKFDNVGTTSSKKFIELLNELNKEQAKGLKKLNIYWYSPYVDEDIIQLGKFYKSFSDNLAKKGNYTAIKFKLKFYNYD